MNHRLFLALLLGLLAMSHLHPSEPNFWFGLMWAILAVGYAAISALDSLDRRRERKDKEDVR